MPIDESLKKHADRSEGTVIDSKVLIELEHIPCFGNQRRRLYMRVCVNMCARVAVCVCQVGGTGREVSVRAAPILIIV